MPTLNQLHMRVGRTPEALSPDEVVVSEGFAKAHGFVPGSRFAAILNGRKLQLTIVGIALSPEFIYTVGPGDIMPDDRRFGIVWMSEKALASAYDLDGAFFLGQPQAVARCLGARGHAAARRHA
jgi:putative ABC transport system permease protein